MADRPQCQHYVCVNSKRTAQLLLCTQNASKLGAISGLLREIGAASLKEKQREALLTFLSGRDTFVVLPTGYDGVWRAIMDNIRCAVLDRCRSSIVDADC